MLTIAVIRCTQLQTCRLSMCLFITLLLAARFRLLNPASLGHLCARFGHDAAKLIDKVVLTLFIISFRFLQVLGAELFARLAWLAAIAVGLALTGCALQPAYQLPQITAAQAWQAEMPHESRTVTLVNWWASFNDPALTALIRLAEADSPTLAQAVAQIDSARATLVSSSATAWPSVTGSSSLSRAKQVGTIGGSDIKLVSTTRSGELDASWELDLFGKARANTESSQAILQARVDDWHDARVSLAAEVADDYMQYRACRLLLDTYRGVVMSQQQTVRTTRVAVAAGLSAPSDGYLAQANAANAAATVVQQNTSCEEFVKSLVAVTGASEPLLRSTIERTTVPALPDPASFNVASVPADLIRQRPDLASAEHTLESYYAAIGAARADRFPSLSLSGSVGISATNLTSPISNWSFGPSLSIPIFDAGRKKAAVNSAQAAYDHQLASYHGLVRKAIKEVEMALVDLDGSSRQIRASSRSAEQYRRYTIAIEANWRAGLETLLTLEQARRSAISAETTLIAQRRDHVRSWIALYKALGGGWQVGNETTTLADDAASSLQGVTE
jgi:NodT family efflux transporter outer membrane factor (OMF) lipoprotein